MRVRFKYFGHKGTVEDRDVDVVSVGFDPAFHPEWGYQPGWYIMGWDYSRDRKGDQYRSFRLDRIVFDENPKQTIRFLDLTGLHK